MGREQATEADGALTLYLRDMGSFRLLTREEEVALAREVEAGRNAQEWLVSSAKLENREEVERMVRRGAEARRRLIEANLPLVLSLAPRYRGLGLELMDLVQEGNMGLQHAVEKFDWRKGCKLSTYAYGWIRQKMSRAIGNQASVIRIPVHQAGKVHIHVHSLDQPVQRNGEEYFLDEMVADETAEEQMTAAEEEMTAAVLRTEVEALLSDLKPREALALRLRYGLGGACPMSLGEAGQLLGVTKQAVGQSVAAALDKLRPAAAERRLGEFIA